ncbi:EF-hand domain-containing protein [Lysobacter sp. CCNWLW3]|uniref:EF-hand domain-containing protein n=1 Tax=unclassified Lysobacter TaxID=2635362 RepID=UPI002FD06D39
MISSVRNPRAILLALSAALAMPLAFAQSAPPPQEPPPSTSGDASQAAPSSGITPAFAEFDVDSNGKISQAEAAIDSQLSRNFATLDKNRDGALSEAEYHAAHAKQDSKRK